jgi:multiple sugar transport system permease protein
MSTPGTPTTPFEPATQGGAVSPGTGTALRRAEDGTDAPTAPPAPVRTRGGWRRRQHVAAYLFLSPWLLGLAAFTVGPMVASLVLSFTDYDLIGEPRFVGADNYARVASDPRVWTSLWNTVLYTVLHVPLTVVCALALAVMMHRVGRAAGAFRTLVYLPVMTPPVAAAAMFLLLLNGQTGLVNEVLGWFGVDGPGWTTDPSWIKPGLVLMSLWSCGSTAVIYLAALHGVPVSLHEAAMLDGANAWQRFRAVTLPMISPAIYFTVIVNTIASLQFFTEAYAMYFGNEATQSRSGDAALFYVIYLFQQAFQFLDMGYASALAWLLFLVIAAIAFVQTRVARRTVHYEGE